MSACDKYLLTSSCLASPTASLIDALQAVSDATVDVDADDDALADAAVLHSFSMKGGLLMIASSSIENRTITMNRKIDRFKQECVEKHDDCHKSETKVVYAFKQEYGERTIDDVTQTHSHFYPWPWFENRIYL